MTALRKPLRRIFSAAVLLCLCLTPSALAAPPGTIIWGYQEGLAKAQSPDGAFGYANVRGEVVIPMLVDGFSMWGVHDLVEQVNGIRSANPVIKIAGVLITQWRNCELVRQGEEMLRNLGLPVFKTVIRRTDKVPESTVVWQPIFDYSPRSAASQDYRLWVDEYLGEEAGSDGEV